MPIALGSADASVRLGGVTPTAVYLGQTLVWPLATSALYFYGSDDDDWANLANWYEDEAGTVQATSLPTALDNVVVAANIDTTSTASQALQPIAVANYTVIDPSNDQYTSNAVVTVSGIATFNGSSVHSGTILGNAVFNDFATNTGAVTGDATFNDDSSHRGGVGGDATFLGSSCNSGSVNGTIIGNPPACPVV
jgi:hypothetical protein